MTNNLLVMISPGLSACLLVNIISLQLVAGKISDQIEKSHISRGTMWYSSQACLSHNFMFIRFLGKGCQFTSEFCVFMLTKV